MKKSLACSALKGASQHLNKVIIGRIAVFFCIYFLFLRGSALITTYIFKRNNVDVGI